MELTQITRAQIEEISRTEALQDLSDQLFLMDLLSVRFSELSNLDFCPADSKTLVTNASAHLLTKISEYRTKTAEMISGLMGRNVGLSEALSLKLRNFDYLRFSARQFAALFCAFEWQSPIICSGDTSPSPGRNLGTIEDNFFFYKRERHYLARELEKQLLSLFEVEQSQRVSSWIFHSGMAAFSTLVQQLTKQELPRVLIGSSCYCENRELLQNILPEKNYSEFDETSSSELISNLENGKFNCLLIDSLANCFTLSSPNLEEIMEVVANIVDDSFTLIIDDTCGLKTKEIIRWLDVAQPSFNVAIIHSLAKYLQYGLDMVPGGLLITWSSTDQFAKLDRLRQLAGTVMSDNAVMCFPTNWATSAKELEVLRGILVRRTSRMVRNRRYLEDRLITSSTGVRNVSVPAHEYGTLLFLQYNQPYTTVDACKSLCRKMVASANRISVPLIHGTSFGFDVTRVSSSRVMSHGASPGIRVSAGTETLEEMELLSQVLSSEL